MKRAQTDILTLQKQNSVIIHFSIVQKQNQTGIFYNQRLLTLIQNQSLGYISKFDLKMHPTQVDIKLIKSPIPIRYIKSVDFDTQNLIVHFTKIDSKKSTQQQKKWTFKMANSKMVEAWHRLLQEQKAKRSLRNSKRSKSNSQSIGSPLVNKNDFFHSPKKPKPKPQSQASISFDPIKEQKSLKPVPEVSEVPETPEQRPLLNSFVDNFQKKTKRENNLIKIEDEKKEQIKKQPAVTIPSNKNVQKQKIKQPIIQPSQPQSQPQLQTFSFLTNILPKDKTKDFQSVTPPKKKLQIIIQEGSLPGKTAKNNKETKYEPPQPTPFRKSSNIQNGYMQIIENIVKEGNQKAKFKQKRVFQPQKNVVYDKSQILNQFIRIQTKTPKAKQNVKKGKEEKNKITMFDWHEFESEPDKTQPYSNQPPFQPIQKQGLQDFAMQILQKQSKKLTSHVDQYARQIITQNQSLRNRRFDIKEDRIQDPIRDLDNILASFSYRFLAALTLKTEDLGKLTQDFQAHCQSTMKFVLQSFLEQSQPNLKPFSGSAKLPKSKYKRNNIIHFDTFHQLDIKIATMGLRTMGDNASLLNVQQRKICDASACKLLEIQYKNYCILGDWLQKIQKEVQLTEKPSLVLSEEPKPKLVIPLMCLVQDQGFIGLFKLSPRSSPRNQINQAFVFERQAEITRLSQIQINFISSNSKYLILHIDEKYYTKAYEAHEQSLKTQNINPKNPLSIYGITSRNSAPRNFTPRHFNIDIITEIDQIIPKDLLAHPLNNEQTLRIQLIQKAKKENFNLSNIIIPNSSQQKIEPQQISEISTTLSQQILKNISEFIIKSDSLQFYFLHPIQLSNKFHQQGLNMRYLGLVYENSNEPIVKHYLLSQIVARVCKLLLRKTLQDAYLQRQIKQPKRLQNSNKQVNMLKEVIDLLNCICGCNYESTAMWKVIDKHSRHYFKIPKINKEQIEKGYFIISLAYHCRLNINWKKIGTLTNSHYNSSDYRRVDELFSINNFFNIEITTGLLIHSKVYCPNLKNENYQKITSILSFPYSEEGFKTIVNQLGLEQKTVPSFSQDISVSLNSQTILKYLAHFIPPQSLINEESKQFLHISIQIYNNLPEYPDQYNLFIRLMQLKWYLRYKKQQKATKKCQQFIWVINKFYPSSYHLCLTELYDLFTSYYLINQNYQSAITFRKSSVINTLKLCGANHIKTAEAYYNLGLVYLQSHRLVQSLELLKKTKLIFQTKNRTQTISYATINLKIALIMLNKGEIQDCMEEIDQKVLGTLSRCQQFSDQDQFSDSSALKIQAYEILFRCYLLYKNKDKLKDLGKIVEEQLLIVTSPKNLEKLLKLMLYPLLASLSPEQSSSFIDIISILPYQPNFETADKAYSMLYTRIRELSLCDNFKNYLANFSNIDDYISVNNSLKNWRSFEKVYPRDTVNDFISLTDELVNFLGEGWITGVLRESFETK